ncbi:enoyl-[acyl-carrier protein] reductase II [Acetomicrobium thermoterrenum DSM 13490]|uniref:Enoyl-[acyl-carrier protein] reductase II n=1 Tax=Acetomicrobium thermoterrenum DSM 13490 TaxID=1120987 RepID=A0A1H3DMB7_9BACT|nr:enoyl-[acyl-carrier-protein] reductase FabK [Acetomicrobium thermoterrenum]SDX67218.1 enoyl-[acyl-carrier protein] reductase II [Acetomicrobium thermoterrenum DSM 13490]
MFKNTRIQELLGLEYPIFQGGMAWVANADLAAAVSNGGGLGVIAAGNMPPELLDREIKRAKSMTDRPFAVNIMLMSPTAEAAIEVVAENRVPVVTTGAGSPGKVIERLKPLGTIIIPVIASVAHAKRVEKQGADAVVAEGTEAGGHIGELTTMVLVPQVADAISIPVVAAGGIADGRGVVAAFALGAEGVQVGTRFVCAVESPAHEAYKRMIIEATDRSTVVTGRTTGHPVRCIKNKLTKRFEEMETAGVSLEELEAFGAGKLRAAVMEGDVEWGSVMAGQSAGLVKKVQPAAEIIKELFSDAERVLRGLENRLE